MPTNPYHAPWTIKQARRILGRIVLRIDNAGDQLVTTIKREVYDSRDDAEAYAIANLIAAAPEMLEALDNALDWVRYYSTTEDAGYRTTINQIEQAIRRAKGERP